MIPKYAVAYNDCECDNGWYFWAGDGIMPFGPYDSEYDAEQAAIASAKLSAAEDGISDHLV